MMPPPAVEGRPIEIERREIVNAILYKLKSGCHWRLLPPGTLWVLPKWQTVYYSFVSGTPTALWYSYMTTCVLNSANNWAVTPS